MLVFIALLSAIGEHAAAQVNQPIIPPESTVAVEECKFKIKNMFGGKVMIPENSTYSPQGIYDLPDTGAQAPAVLRSFALVCVDASDKKIGTKLNAKKVNGQWMQYNPWPNENIPELMPFDPGARPRTIPLEGRNWTGIGLTVDSTTGDEESRHRMLYFCLIHKSHALCGKAPVQWLADRKKRNDLWKIKAILESVEFVDAPPPAESDPKNPSPAAQ